MAAQGNLCSKKVVADVLDITERRVAQLTADGILTEHSPGHYKLLPAIKQYIAYLKSLQTSGVQKPKTAHEQEKERLARIKRESAELDLQLKKNELHKSSDVEFIMTNMLIAFKSKLEVLPYKVLPSVVNVPDGENKADYIVGILNAAVEEALNELSEYDPGMFDEETYLASLDDTVAEEVS